MKKLGKKTKKEKVSILKELYKESYSEMVELFPTTTDALIWFITPTDYWLNKSPFIWCLLGEHEEVIKFLKERSGKK